MRLLQEFKEFAMKGNMVDLAVGVIIGAAFGAVVSSLVADVLMPPLGWLSGGLDFKDKVIIIQHKGATHPLTHKVLPADVVLRYGQFINTVINFLIVAIAIFALIKLINRMRREPPPKPAEPPPPTKEEQLLTDIRDLLASRTAL